MGRGGASSFQGRLTRAGGGRRVTPGGTGRRRAFFEAAVAAGSYPIATASGAATVTASSRGASLVSPAVLYQRLPTVIYDLADRGVDAPADLYDDAGLGRRPRHLPPGRGVATAAWSPARSPSSAAGSTRWSLGSSSMAGMRRSEVSTLCLGRRRRRGRRRRDPRHGPPQRWSPSPDSSARWTNPAPGPGLSARLHAVDRG